MSEKIKRPILRYFGGKWKLAPWIIGHFPEHKIYVEPFCGAASVFFQKDRAKLEILNDKDKRIFNLFRIFQTPALLAEFKRRVKYIPFSQNDFDAAYAENPADEIDEALKFVVRSFFGFGSTSNGKKGKSGFRGNTEKITNLKYTGINNPKITKTGFRGGIKTIKDVPRNPANDWANWKTSVDALACRLDGVRILNKDACDMLADFDSVDTLFYADPPYLEETRTENGSYLHEFSGDKEHKSMIAALKDLQGAVILSGYKNDLYAAELDEWKRFDRRHYSINAKVRVESVWLNPKAFELLNKREPLLF